jgi:hypothetical protein
VRIGDARISPHAELGLPFHLTRKANPVDVPSLPADANVAMAYHQTLEQIVEATKNGKLTVSVKPQA